MIKKRIIYSVATAALGLSLVGVANADTLANIKPNMVPKSIQSTLNMPSEDMNENMTKMQNATNNINQSKAEVKITNNSDEENQTTLRMNSNNMENPNELHNQMYENHENNHEAMTELHNDMPMNQIHMYYEDQSQEESTRGTYNTGHHMNSNELNRHMMGR